MSQTGRPLWRSFRFSKALPSIPVGILHLMNLGGTSLSILENSLVCASLCVHYQTACPPRRIASNASFDAAPVLKTPSCSFYISVFRVYLKSGIYSFLLVLMPSPVRRVCISTV